eukprot:scaffold4823_cov98-Isochrysis_galbana.AAC.6
MATKTKEKRRHLRRRGRKEKSPSRGHAGGRGAGRRERPTSGFTATGKVAAAGHRRVDTQSTGEAPQESEGGCTDRWVVQSTRLTRRAAGLRALHVGPLAQRAKCEPLFGRRPRGSQRPVPPAVVEPGLTKRAVHFGHVDHVGRRLTGRQQRGLPRRFGRRKGVAGAVVGAVGLFVVVGGGVDVEVAAGRLQLARNPQPVEIMEQERPEEVDPPKLNVERRARASRPGALAVHQPLALAAPAPLVG